jgi:hypothetical protein
MPDDFFAGYSERTDDELLHLASARHSLTTEASAALGTELRRRNLTESDRIEQQRFVKRQEQREARKHRRKTFGPFKYKLAWLDFLLAFAVIGLISFGYIALPSRYHFIKPEWQDPSFIVMMTSVLIAITCRSLLWRKIAFWMSLGISSAIHLVAIHALTQRVPSLSRGAVKGAAVLGFLLFVAVYGSVQLLLRIFQNEEDQTTHSGDGHVLSS